MSLPIDRTDGTLLMLARVAESLTATDPMDPANTLYITARELCADTRFPLVRAWRVEEGGLSPIGTWAEGANRVVVERLDDPGDDRARSAPSTMVRQAAVSRAICCTNFSGDPDAGVHGIPAASVCSCVAIPIRSGPGVIAVLEVFCGRPLQDDDEILALGTVLASILSRDVGLPSPGSPEPREQDHAEDEQAALAGLLRSALARGEFSLAYQPQVSLVSDRIVGAEALLRWERPEGLISPMSFIPLAEATGDIVAIGAWVLEEACRQAASWKDLFPDMRPWSISVNVSPRQFRADLVSTVRSALSVTGLPPESLQLELTETMLIEDAEFAQSVLEDLRGLGVLLSLDDFGTGYSSLAYFQQLPLDEVKIDRLFVKGLGVSRGDTAIVASVVSLAHALERVVVAEGVETRDQLEHLRALGCEVVQGFLFSRPLPAAELEQMLTSASPTFELLVEENPDSEAARLPTVLVVDDSAVVRELATICLTAAGFSVSSSATAGEGLAAASADRPDALVLDRRLPDMSGVEVCAALRSDPETAGCTIVMLTSADGHIAKAEAFNAGADDYIVKPFIPRELVARVQGAMRRRART